VFAAVEPLSLSPPHAASINVQDMTMAVRDFLRIAVL
jgi:hypothetical protein